MGKFISFDQLCGGAALERFNLAMAQIAKNIMDPNTDPKKARTLTIKLTFKPDEGRKCVSTSVAANVSLAPPIADETVLLIGKDLRTGRIEVNEYGDKSQTISVAGESLPVRAEVMSTAPVPRSFDPATGEIIEPTQAVMPQAGQKPIDLRAAT